MTIKITGITETPPGGLVVIHAEADGREVSFGPVARRALLRVLNAEPDETDYQEVLAENHSLGQRLSQKVSEGHRIRGAIGLSETEDIRLVLARINELEKGDQDAPEGPRDDQAQIDRSWALERAGEVIGRLAAVGVYLSDPEKALGWAAEWILTGEEGPEDRG